MSFLRHPFLSLLAFGLLATYLNPVSAGDGVALLRERSAADRPQLMLLGTYHFANHGADVINSQVPDVLEPARQEEMAAVANALAKFKPTKVVVEYPIAKQDKMDQRYQAYRSGAYALTRDEVDQLGLRIASLLGHDRVHAVDWNKMPPGRVEDFDYVQWSERNGQQARLATMRDPSRARKAENYMAGSTIASWLVKFNEPEQLAASHRNYFDYTLLGDSSDSPGANWVANWYGRNLKIFANLVRLADQPSDRVLVIYGQGHIFLLREFAEQSGAFNVVSPVPLLQSAAGQSQP